MSKVIEAVFFDLFGVYVKYLDNERSLGLIKKILEDPELKETVFEFERGRVAVSDLPELALISHPPLANIEDWEQAEFWSIVRGEDDNIVKAIKKLRQRGIKVGLFCNNGFLTRKFERSCIPEDLSLFDAVVESCRIGYRKADSESYHIAAEMINVSVDKCVLVDDSSLNVEGAIREGMKGIHQKGEDSLTAIKQLEELVGFPLLD